VDLTILYPWHKSARTRKAERIAKTAAREGNFNGISHVYGMVSCGLEKGGTYWWFYKSFKELERHFNY
jgi:hypothetical protein